MPVETNKLQLLEPAQLELEEIALTRLNLVGPTSARKLTDQILNDLDGLRLFPLSGVMPQDRQLYSQGYRFLLGGKYICVYRLVERTVFVYHIAHGASNYPELYKRLLNPETE